MLLPLYHADKSLSSLTIDGVKGSVSGSLELGQSEYAQIIVSAQEHAIKATYS
jgi:hypothetical protein